MARIRCFSPRRVECDVAAALRRWVLHGGGLLGVVLSASFDFYCSVVTLEREVFRRLQECGLWVGAVVVLQFCSRHRVEWWSYRVEFEWSCVAVLMSQSNWQVRLFLLLVVPDLGVVSFF